jgi:hypothetical protein
LSARARGSRADLPAAVREADGGQQCVHRPHASAPGPRRGAARILLAGHPVNSSGSAAKASSGSANEGPPPAARSVGTAAADLPCRECAGSQRPAFRRAIQRLIRGDFRSAGGGLSPPKRRESLREGERLQEVASVHTCIDSQTELRVS